MTCRMPRCWRQKREFWPNLPHISTWELISIVDLKICEKLNINFSEYTESREDRIGKDASYKLDSSKTRNELHWEEKISLDEGIERTIEWVERIFSCYPMKRNNIFTNLKRKEWETR